jgi:hypothetical protein
MRLKLVGESGDVILDRGAAFAHRLQTKAPTSNVTTHTA